MSLGLGLLFIGSKMLVSMMLFPGLPVANLHTHSGQNDNRVIGQPTKAQHMRPQLILRVTHSGQNDNRVWA